MPASLGVGNKEPFPGMRDFLLYPGRVGWQEKMKVFLTLVKIFLRLKKLNYENEKMKPVCAPTPRTAKGGC
jgi:hypothetical protein